MRLRFHGTISTILGHHINLPVCSVPSFRRFATEAMLNNNLIGQCGCRYTIERTLQDKQRPLSKVYLASAGEQKFVLKEIPRNNFEYLSNMYGTLGGCHHVRLLHDTIPDRSIFVFRYLTDSLLTLVHKDPSIISIKRILKDTLRGLAALHDRNIVHTDIKANNIMIDCDEGSQGIMIKEVQLTDIEDAACVPVGSDIVGKAVGNEMWRSPEAHALGRVNKPSDMFSLGIVCVYAISKVLLFAVDKTELAEGIEPQAEIIERQISYFADEDGMSAFLNHLGDNPWSEVFKVLRDGFNEENPRRPFRLFKDVDPIFKDLVVGLTNFNPAKRLSVHEALAHQWFKDV